MDKRIADRMDSLVRHPTKPVFRLAHLFRLQVGMTPQQFLESQRLHRAQQRLELTSRLISAVATEVGYENPFYFTQRFKRATGLSPRGYRYEYSFRRSATHKWRSFSIQGQLLLRPDFLSISVSAPPAVLAFFLLPVPNNRDETSFFAAWTRVQGPEPCSISTGADCLLVFPSSTDGPMHNM